MNVCVCIQRQGQDINQTEAPPKTHTITSNRHASTLCDTQFNIKQRKLQQTTESKRPGKTRNEKEKETQRCNRHVKKTEKTNTEIKTKTNKQKRKNKLKRTIKEKER